MIFRKSAAFLALLLLVPLAYLLSGVDVVPPGEVLVVRRFGRMLDMPWQPGLHWGLPIPWEQRDRIRTMEVRRLDLGLAGIPGPGDDPAAAEFLTGDLNMILLRAVVQYRVVDPEAHLRNLQPSEVEPLLRRLSEGCLARELAGRTIDDVLRTARGEVAESARLELARMAERLGLGLTILGVSLTDVRPPVEVAPAFAEAQAARSVRELRIREADIDGASVLAGARAEAGARLERARAEANRTESLAQARAERFLALQSEKVGNPQLTVRRLYLDAIREILPRLRRKVVLGPLEPVDLTIFGSDDVTP